MHNLDNLIKHRRNLHQIPETAFNEIKTQEYILNFFKSLPRFKILTPYKTSVVAILEGGDSSILFRADMDALKIEESTDLSFKSQNKGFMHACGHDGHMSILLSFASYLHNYNFNKTFVLVFQPAEEGPGGAKELVKQDLFNSLNIEAAFGLHLWPDLEIGKISSRKGAFMAGPSEFDIDILGKAGHGAKPHETKDAVLIASQLILRYQTIISRKVNPLSPSVLTIGKMTSGTVRNVIAETARLEGTIRTFDSNLMMQIINDMQKIHKAIEIEWDCKIKEDIRIAYPPVVNDDNWVEFLQKNIDPNCYKEADPSMIAEDFSYFINKFGGAFFFLGVKSKNIETYSLHHSKFNFDEKALLTGLETYINIASNYKI